MSKFRFAMIVFIAVSPSLSLKPNAQSSGPRERSDVASIGPCQVFPSDNAWNLNIANAPVHPNSANYITNINTNGSGTMVHPDFGSTATYGIPYITVTGSQPKVPINFTSFGSQSDPGPYPIPPNAPVESGSDGHALVIDTTNCLLYEMYQAVYTNPGWDAGSGAVYNLNSNALRPDTWTSADAAGLPIFPGLARCDEANSGVINHALRFTVHKSQAAHIYPARHDASSLTGTNYPPMGLRFRLKASYDISTFTGQARPIAQALKTYGMIVADNGSNWYISGETNPSCWNDNDLNELKSIPGTAFEVILSSGPPQSIGLYAPSSANFYLRDSNSAGNADFAYSFGPVPSNLIPLSGDWTGQGAKTVGLYDPGSGFFYLKNSNSGGNADIIFSFGTGGAGLLPIVGDWTGQGKDTVGLYNPANAFFYLKNSNSTGNADIIFSFGPPNANLLPISGDWIGQGHTTIGLYSAANAYFYLRNSNSSGSADIAFQYGPANLGSPLTGKWHGSGQTTIGVYVPANAYFYLKNTNVAGNADAAFQYGPGPNAGWKSVIGNWDVTRFSIQ